MHISNYERLEYFILITPLHIIAEVAEPPNIPGTVNEHRGSDEWLAFFFKLILGLLIGTMAVLDGLFSTPIWANPLL